MAVDVDVYPRTSSAVTPSWTATVASEWTKFCRLRFARVMVLTALLLAAAAAAILLVTTPLTRGEPLREIPPSAAAEIALLGTDVANIVLILLSASAVASEYRIGQIRITLTATPRRGRVLGAKVAVLVGTALVGGLLSALLVHLVGRLILYVQSTPAATLGDPDVLRLLLGGAVMVPFYSLLAAALAFVTRNAGGAFAAVFAIMSLPALVGFLPDAWQQALLPLLPAGALHSVAGVVSPAAPEYLPVGLAAVVLLVWAVGSLLGAYAVFVKRDA